MNFPSGLKYTKDHEWAKVEGKSITAGVTDHAQKALGDIVYVDLPAVGRTLKKGETFGVVESIKAVSDLYSPIAGKVTAVNPVLTDNPAIINREPYTTGWMIKMEIMDESSLADMMDAAAYQKYVETLK